jgi:TonB family protein
MKKMLRSILLLALCALSLRMAPFACAAEPAGGAGQRSKEGRLQVPPKAVKQPQPEFPRGLIRLGLVGEVDVDFVIDTAGNVQNPVVAQSNNPWFERAAIIAILKWKFTPAEVDGRKVMTRARQKIVFSLWGGQSPWELANLKAKKNLPPEMQWDNPPVPVHTGFPVYPFEALQTGLKGKVRLLYVIDEKGRVAETKLLEATTPEMGQAALATIDMWRFKPASRKDGTKVSTLLGMEYEFSPDGEGGVPVSDAAQDILHDLRKNPDAIVRATDLDQPLKPLSQRPPIYPTGLRKANQVGEAVIEFFVDREGDAQLPRVVSCTAPEFGYAAAQAVATWRFEVPKKDRRAVVTKARISLSFSLKGGD